MTPTEKKYALERITGIEQRAIHLIMTKHTTPAVKLSWQKKKDLINAGAVMLLPSVKDFTDISRAFDFSQYETEEKIDKKMSIETKQCMDAFQKVKDELMLGDSTAALETLRSLEKQWN